MIIFNKYSNQTSEGKKLLPGKRLPKIHFDNQECFQIKYVVITLAVKNLPDKCLVNGL